MALKNKRSQKLKDENNTGFGSNSNSTGGRFYNKDGNVNVTKRGVSLLNRFSWYHTMLAMSRGKFLLLLFSVYIIVNILFACIYYMIGVQHLAGIDHSNPLKEFMEVFFFSTQTFTTVGYGRISPTGFLTSAVSTFEAFLGLLSFAIATGLFYGRFSRPQAFLKFSDIAVIGPFKEGTALMFRLSTFKNNFLSDAEVKITMAISEEENGRIIDRFYTLDLQISKVNALALSWTIVHPIDEKSPFFGMTKEDIQNTDIEIFVFVKAFDEVFSNTVMAKTSYVSAEIEWGAKFKIMYYPSEDKNTTILDLNLLNAIDKVELPKPATLPAVE